MLALLQKFKMDAEHRLHADWDNLVALRKAKPVFYQITTQLLQLAELSEELKDPVLDMFLGISEHSWWGYSMKSILTPNVLLIPSALVDLCGALNYNICDDGVLRIIKAEFNRGDVNYFVDAIDDCALEQRIDAWKHRFGIVSSDVKLAKMSVASFRDVQDFANFMARFGYVAYQVHQWADDPNVFDDVLSFSEIR